MSDFNEKFKEYESNKKKTNRDGIILIALVLVVFSFLFMYNIYTKKEKRLAEETSAYIEREIVSHEKQDSILNIEKRKQDDSIKQTIQQLKQEIVDIKSSPDVSSGVLQKINVIENKLYKIESITDQIIVRYYKRLADRNMVEKAIKSIAHPNFNLHYRDVPNDDGKTKNNTLYYGKNVKKEYAELLRQRLLNNNIKIDTIKPFLSAKGFEWKKDAIEIGYEKRESQTEENAKLFINIYSYRSNQKIKEAIRNKLEAKGFQVKLYPDWTRKPSFFSDESTVLYYHESQKRKAELIARVISDLVSIKFKVKMGSGYGTKSKEVNDMLKTRDNTFIIHYNGK